MGMKARPVATETNASPQAQRAITKLARSNGLEEALVRTAAQLTWDFDRDARNEAKGWIARDERLVRSLSVELARMAMVLGLKSTLVVDQSRAIQANR